MRIKVTGINGYVGQLLAQHFREKGNRVSGIQRKLLYGDIKYLKEEISQSDVIINLAGASILQRWTKRNMRRIYKSRINTTQNLVNAIHALPKNEQPKQIISASAIGIYQNGILHDESSTVYDNGFVGHLVKDWEGSYHALPNTVKLSIFRIGVVIGKESQTMKKMLPVFNVGIGGQIGTGKQAFPFIHEKDLVKAFEWVTETSTEQSTFNLVAPEQITNKQFTKKLSEKLNKPAFCSVPSFVLKIVYGKASSLMLKSPFVTPKAMLDAGYQFKYPTIDTALDEILK